MLRRLALAMLAAVAVLALVAFAAGELLLLRVSVDLWRMLKHLH